MNLRTKLIAFESPSAMWVGNVDENNVYTQYHFDWHRAREIGCLVNGTCSIDPSALYLPEDDYIWFILSYNPAGLGMWSSAGEFTVNKPQHHPYPLWR